MNIIHTSTHMRLSASDRSPLETECLFGEKVQILDTHLDWVFCKLKTDNYLGWVKKNSLGNLGIASHRVINKSSFIYKDCDPKSEILLNIPMGARLTVINIYSDWAKVHLIINGKLIFGFVPKGHIVHMKHKVKDWVAAAEQLKGAPYKWGGRNTIGIDCSALLQLSYETYGQIIPRNTSQQLKLPKKLIKDFENLKRGCVIFWKGHVGIMVDRYNCIHANAYHMKTIIEPLFDIINRADKENQIIKMMDFN